MVTVPIGLLPEIKRLLAAYKPQIILAVHLIQGSASRKKGWRRPGKVRNHVVRLSLRAKECHARPACMVGRRDRDISTTSRIMGPPVPRGNGRSAKDADGRH